MMAKARAKLLVIVFLMAGGVAGQPQNRVPIRVGIYPQKPLGFMDEQGIAQGFYPDLLREVFNAETKYELVFVPINWAQGLDMLQHEELDLMIAIARTPEREKTMDYNASPVFEAWCQVFARVDHHLDQVTDLSGKRVGVMEKDNFSRIFNELLQRLSVQCELVSYPSHTSIFEAIKAEEIDAGVAPHHFGNAHATTYMLRGTPIQFSPSLGYFAAKKGHNARVLSMIDQQLFVWKQDPHSFYFKRMDYWLSGKYENTGFPSWVWYGLLGLLSFILLQLGIIILLNRRVKNQVLQLAEDAEQFHLLFDNMPTGCAIIEVAEDGKDFIIIDLNLSGLKEAHLKHEDLIGRKVTEVFPGIVEMGLFDVLQRVWRTSEPEQLDQALYTDKRISGWLENHVFKLPRGQIVAMFKNITDRKMFLDEIQAHKIFMDAVIDQSPIPMWVSDRTGTLVRANQALCKTLHIEEADMVGHYNILQDGNVQGTELEEVIQGVFERGETAHISTRWKTTTEGHMAFGKEQELHIHATMIPILDQHGKPSHVVCQWIDDTARKDAENALRKSNEMMRNSQSVAHICAYSTDLNIHEVGKSAWICSPEFYKIFGIDETYPHTIDGWANFIHPDFRDEVVAYHESVIKEQTTFNLEYKIIRINDGEERWVHGTGKLEFDPKGIPIRMHGAIQDITQQRQAAEELRQSEAFKEKMVSHIGDVITVIDREGINRFKSPNIERWFGWKPEEVLGRPALENIHPDDIERTTAVLEKLRDTPGALETVECRYRCKDGHYKWIGFAGNNLLDDPDIRGILGNYRDISERKEAEQQLIDHNKKLEWFNKAAVGRELRMVELKKEINALCKLLGKDIPYGRFSP